MRVCSPCTAQHSCMLALTCVVGEASHDAGIKLQVVRHAVRLHKMPFIRCAGAENPGMQGFGIWGSGFEVLLDDLPP